MLHNICVDIMKIDTDTIDLKKVNIISQYASLGTSVIFSHISQAMRWVVVVSLRWGGGGGWVCVCVCVGGGGGGSKKLEPRPDHADIKSK